MRLLLEGALTKPTILAAVGWAVVGIGLFFALWVSYLISVAFSGCGIFFCHWTVEMLLRILMITGLPIGLGALIIRYDEMRRKRTERSLGNRQTGQR